MGLAKTIQVIAFLAALHFSGMYKPYVSTTLRYLFYSSSYFSSRSSRWLFPILLPCTLVLDNLLIVTLTSFHSVIFKSPLLESVVLFTPRDDFTSHSTLPIIYLEWISSGKFISPKKFSILWISESLFETNSQKAVTGFWISSSSSSWALTCL